MSKTDDRVSQLRHRYFKSFNREERWQIIKDLGVRSMWQIKECPKMPHTIEAKVFNEHFVEDRLDAQLREATSVMDLLERKKGLDIPITVGSVVLYVCNDHKSGKLVEYIGRVWEVKDRYVQGIASGMNFSAPVSCLTPFIGPVLRWTDNAFERGVRTVYWMCHDKYPDWAAKIKQENDIQDEEPSIDCNAACAQGRDNSWTF